MTDQPATVDAALAPDSPRTERSRRILAQDYRGNEVYTVTRDDLLAIEREARADSAGTEPEPRHTEGQGEVCDTFCPHWGWSERRRDSAGQTAGAGMGVPTVSMNDRQPARRMLGQVLGRHHRQLLVSGVNCAACHGYSPTSTDLINAIEAEAAAPPLDDVEAASARLEELETALRDLLAGRYGAVKRARAALTAGANR